MSSFAFGLIDRVTGVFPFEFVIRNGLYDGRASEDGEGSQYVDDDQYEFRRWVSSFLRLFNYYPASCA